MNKPVYVGANTPNPIDTALWVQEKPNQKELKLYNEVTKTWDSVSKESIDQVNTDWNATEGKAELLNKPESLPASDVSAWAKAASKPSYSYSELTGTKPTYSYSEITGTKPPIDAQKNSDITKAEIEAKLTGAIASHSHALPGVATTTSNGLMSSADKAKLDGIDAQLAAIISRIEALENTAA